MNIYTSLGIQPIINAADTLTILGGSRIPDDVSRAMVEASQHFVVIEELLDAVGERIAKLTKNEAAFVTSGAAAGMAVATAACITGTHPDKIDRLPSLDGLKNEVIVHRAQRNKYDHAIRQVGVNIVEIGNVEATYSWQLESAITEQTACIFYFAASNFSRGALPLADVIAIGKERNIPVIVDAAAQLPPVDNLWRYTQMGADLAIFSGGKALRGPQASGLIVGKKHLVEACKLNANPNRSLGRSMKVGKEEIIGLLVALERYINLDHEAKNREYERYINYLREELTHPDIAVDRIYPGPVGQSYPRAFVSLKAGKWTAARLKAALENSEYRIIVTLSDDEKGIIINPLVLNFAEVKIIATQLKRLLHI